MNAFEGIDKESVEKILEKPEPRLDRDSTTVIYLDQKIWGHLHAGRHDSDSQYTEAYQIVRDAVSSGEVICPYSMARLIETDKHPDEEFKRELYDLMIDFSNNICLRNYFDAIGAEITAYIFNHVDILPEIDPSNQVYGRGLVEAHGRPRITSDGEPIEDEWKVHKFHRSEQATRQMVQSEDFFDDIPEPRNEEERAQYVESLESKRQKYDSIDGADEERREQLIIESFRNDVLPGILQTASKFPFDIDTLSIITRDTALKDFHDFFMQFPTYYTHLDLILGRDFHWDRDIEANDLYDVMPLAVAIPYTDVVVTEQFFGGIAYQQGLPDRFGTTVHTDLQGLADSLSDT